MQEVVRGDTHHGIVKKRTTAYVKTCNRHQYFNQALITSHSSAAIVACTASNEGSFILTVLCSPSKLKKMEFRYADDVMISSEAGLILLRQPWWVSSRTTIE